MNNASGMPGVSRTRRLLVLGVIGIALSGCAVYPAVPGPDYGAWYPSYYGYDGYDGYYAPYYVTGGNGAVGGFHGGRGFYGHGGFHGGGHGGGFGGGHGGYGGRH
jgi:hypothetical protein